ncbi:Gti1/Pac2 family domain containing protein [Amanita muscaria]|uniref:Gti1/Pac2 family-domain-containing protein n=1 Tax=Amanita muscaria (strain Koide BX008) TaxID=946122 RepID=A0A0C2X2P0_AMAMK|nr:hypothetical protein M378DRAFT_80417 [Amanita muscaria Koide BX008]
MSFAPAYSYPASRTGAGSVTHPSLHVRDAHDAHVVLEAVRRNILPLIKRRLLTSEREDLKSGHVYVWEEAQDEGGLLRWTDGRRWSQSRMRGDYLFYEEKIETTQEEREAKAARRARRASDPNAVIPPPVRRKDRPSKPNGLTKQTYSAIVNFPETGETRKWHVVAYFSGNDYTRLPVIEYYDYLRSIRVPPGIFVNSKTSNSKMDRSSCYSDDSEKEESLCGSPMQSPISYTSSLRSSHVTGPVSPPLTSAALLNGRHLPLPQKGHRLLPPIVDDCDITLRTSLVLPHLKPPRANSTSSSTYAPLTPEDRRALEKLRVVL